MCKQERHVLRRAYDCLRLPMPYGMFIIMVFEGWFVWGPAGTQTQTWHMPRKSCQTNEVFVLLRGCCCRAATVCIVGILLLVSCRNSCTTFILTLSYAVLLGMLWLCFARPAGKACSPESYREWRREALARWYRQATKLQMLLLALHCNQVNSTSVYLWL